MEHTSDKFDWENDHVIFYKFICNDLNVTSCYVGHTTNFKKRKSQHQTCCNNSTSNDHNLKIYKIIRENGGLSNWDIVEIDKQICKNHAHAKIIEQEWIEKLKPDMNTYKATLSDNYKDVEIPENITISDNTTNSKNSLNYHQLVNLKKRLELFDCEISKEFIALTDKHIVNQLKISKQKDKERRAKYQKEYMIQPIKCEVCNKEFTKKYFYKHTKMCIPTTNEIN
jgi:hypothetical protein